MNYLVRFLKSLFCLGGFFFIFFCLFFVLFFNCLLCKKIMLCSPDLLGTLIRSLDQTGLELVVFLPVPFKYWSCRHVLPFLAWFLF